MSHPPAESSLQDAHRHHQAGRLSAAEAIYRRIIDDDPDHAEALHWLGVLAHQAGRHDDAASFISRAIKISPDDPAYHHNFGEVCMVLGRFDEATSAFVRAVALQPERAESYLALGLATQRAGRFDGAIEAFGHAARVKPGYVDAHHCLAVAQLSAGRPDDAIVSACEVVRLCPGHLHAFVTLGVAHAKLKQWPEAEENLRRAIDLDPNHARAYQNLASVFAAQGRDADAKAILAKAIKVDPTRPGAYQGLAAITGRESGPEQAMPLFKQAVVAARVQERMREMATWSPPGDLSNAIAATETRLGFGPNMERVQFMLSLIDGVGAPPVVPAPSVTRHFDQYAARFDEHLVKNLRYAGPKLLLDAIGPHVPSGARLDILDLGCGTGLVGEILLPMKRLMYGVDLSSNMLDHARNRRVYDALEQAEVCQALEECQPTFDLVVAGDVFVYIGDLSRVFRAVVPVLRPGGLFAFTVESQDAGTYKLMPTGRYVHSETYLRTLAIEVGLEVVSISQDVLRTERGKDVTCRVAVFRRTSIL